MIEQKVTLNKEVWSGLATEWAVGIPPYRPSQEEIALYREGLEAIQKKKGEPIKALVLGATPELRDLLARLEIKTTILDINPNMIRAMTELLEYSLGDEEVLVGNWLAMPIDSETFDVVLCDHGIHHIPFEKWGDFYGEIGRVLKKDGYVLNSVITMEEYEKLTLKQIISAYRKNLFSIEDKWYCLYRSLLGLEEIKGKSYCKDLKIINDQLDEMLNKKEITKEEYDFWRVPAGIADFKVVWPPKQETDRVFIEHFLLKSIKVSFVHPVFSCYKIYFGKKR